MSGLDRATTASVRDAIANADEHEGLLQAITQEGAGLSPQAVKLASQAIVRALTNAFPNINAAKGLAVISTVAANMSADLLMQIESADPISNAGRDGRVKAVETFFERLLKRAVEYRAMLAIKLPGQPN